MWSDRKRAVVRLHLLFYFQDVLENCGIQLEIGVFQQYMKWFLIRRKEEDLNHFF